MDKRNSKETLLNHIEELERKLEEVYDAGVCGIGHVGSANYASRIIEAEKKLETAMYGE